MSLNFSFTVVALVLLRDKKHLFAPLNIPLHKKHPTITPVKFSWMGETLWLSERRCIFWEEEKTLIISDPHFGKTGHFRKAGIGVPQKSFQNDLYRLFEIIQFFKPKKLLITGDLFHSAFNKEIEHFFKWRRDISYLPVILVKGNHDRFPNDFYEKQDIAVYDEVWSKKQFCFTHDPASLESGSYIFSGHVHPSIKINGFAKQSLILPCFYFGAKAAILPAFGNFTGTHPLSPTQGDIIFAITQREVIRL